MAGNQVNDTEGGQVDFDTHARDYVRVMGLLKWSAIVGAITVFLIMLIISN